MKRALLIVLFISLFLLVGAKDAFARQAWAVIDANTGRLLMGSNEHVRLPIASLTKIWTAFTVIESGAPFGEIHISPEAASAEGSSLYLQQNAVEDVEGLLNGLMLRSGNDAAYALAEHAGGSLEGFVDLMNEKAFLYSLNDTVFTNPSGLHNEEHLSTAYDTARMLYHAMQNDTFKEIATTKNYVYEKGETTYNWSNKHRLLHSEPTAIAGKTGFTKVAGRTLATFFEKDDKKIIVVTLNDGNDWNTHKSLANEVFSSYKLVTVAKSGTYDILPGIEGELQSPIQLLLKKGEKKELSHIVHIPRGTDTRSTGTWTVSFGNEVLITSPISIRK
ncbi:D-alanyl-D-alanine carboxypeptidase family protein [Sporosarcina sp. G11-34]|uniref:D-alanyl-D-alanine carboxypeptidase family protein n=1 Tax=Sporosarcina sp. G11-34 TaxID=2849605 RepID=UPI0022A97C2B|nr:D-alanyl-D-alanine carboxypeptidase [Sporosarcina sp. G11-34]MCZ2259497.1 D-alanyl-D-alanine carboxypeptidase [Sporosarcina sp. G11-34]